MAPTISVAAAQARPLKWVAIAGAAVVVAALVVGASFYFHREPVLTDKDTIVLADFTNTTGEPVFDDTLKQALSVELAQSPFLNILSDRKVGETLRLMGRSPNDHVTQEVARELCLRTGSKAILASSISSLGSQYVIGLEAINCQTDDTLVEEQARAKGKDEVLKELPRGLAPGTKHPSL